MDIYLRTTVQPTVHTSQTHRPTTDSQLCRLAAAQNITVFHKLCFANTRLVDFQTDLGGKCDYPVSDKREPRARGLSPAIRLLEARDVTQAQVQGQKSTGSLLGRGLFYL